MAGVVQEIEKTLQEFKCKLDQDALEYLAEVWEKRCRNRNLREWMKILADYDYGDTESGCMDRKTVEIFLDDEIFE